MFIPVLTAYLELIRFGFHIRRRNFAALHSAVRNSRVHKQTPRCASVEKLCRAVDLAASGTAEMCFACNAPRPSPVCFDDMEYAHSS